MAQVFFLRFGVVLFSPLFVRRAAAVTPLSGGAAPSPGLPPSVAVFSLSSGAVLLGLFSFWGGAAFSPLLL